MDNTHWHEKIDDYLDGLLTETERAGMDAALAQDHALAHALRLHRAEREALDLLSADQARADFLRWTADAGPDVPLPGHIPWWRRFRRLLLGGVVVLGLALWFWKSGTSSENTTPLPTPPAPVVPKTESAPVDAPAPENAPKGKQPIAERTPQVQHKPDVLQPKDNTALDNTDAIAAVGDDELQSLFSSPEESALRNRNANADTDADKKFAAGFLSFKNAKSLADYQWAADQFGAIDSTEHNFIASRYMQAHAFFKMRQYEAAANGFRFVFEQRKTLYFREAKWKEALSLYGAFGAELKQKLIDLPACRSGTGPCGKHYDRLLESLRWVVENYPPQAQNARILLERLEQ